MCETGVTSETGEKRATGKSGDSSATGIPYFLLVALVSLVPLVSRRPYVCDTI
jgi:hypothetical protein